MRDSDSAIPTKLGRYEVISRLGSGGMGEVFLAKLPGPRGFAKKVAIKRLSQLFGTQERYVEVFVDEARLVSQLTHPNLVQVQAFEKIADNYFMVMEYLEGLTLLDIIFRCYERNFYPPLEFVVHVARETCEGLDFAHSACTDDGTPLNLVHRDIKPSNIMVTVHGQVKILDFGLAKARSALRTPTLPGTAKGTLGYMSPEQLSGAPNLGPVADLFSLGVTLYELTMLEPLYLANSIPDLLEETEEGLSALARARLNEVRPELTPVIEKLVQPDPRDRFQNAIEVRNALEPLAGRYSASDAKKFLQRLRTGPNVVGSFSIGAPVASTLPEAALGPSALANMSTLPGSSPSSARPPRDPSRHNEARGDGPRAGGSRQASSDKAPAPTPFDSRQTSEAPTVPSFSAAERLPKMDRAREPGPTHLPPDSWDVRDAGPEPKSRVRTGYSSQYTPIDAPPARGHPPASGIRSDKKDIEPWKSAELRALRGSPRRALALLGAIGAFVVLFLFLYPGQNDRHSSVAGPETTSKPNTAVTEDLESATSPKPTAAGSRSTAVQAAMETPAREKLPAHDRKHGLATHPPVRSAGETAPSEQKVSGKSSLSASRTTDQGASSTVLDATPNQATGTLNVNADVYSTVYLDGQKVGFTPFLGQTVPAGQHKVRLVPARIHGMTFAEKTFEVAVGGGTEVFRVWSFGQNRWIRADSRVPH